VKGVAAGVVVLLGAVFVYWGGTALSWGEWLLVGWTLCMGTVIWLMERAPKGFEDEHGFHADQDEPDLFVPDEWGWPERRA
jgi:hypothetical protein